MFLWSRQWGFSSAGIGVFCGHGIGVFVGRGIGACRAECAGASGFFREKTWSCAKKREKKVHSPWPNAYRTRVLKRRQGSYSTALGRETGNRPLSPMWCCSIIRRTPDMGQGIAVVYLYNSIYTLPLSLIWCSSYYISTPHMGQNPFRRSAHPFPSHFPVHRAWEESFPATPPNGAAPAAAAGRILPPARTRDGGGGAHHGRRQRSAQGRPRDRWREGRRGRGRRETGQWWLRGRGWSGSAPRRLLQADSVAQSASTIPSSTRARPRRDPAQPRQHRRGTSVPQCHLFSDFCLFL